MMPTNQYRMVSEVIRNIAPVSPSEIEILVKQAEKYNESIGDRGVDFSDMSTIEKFDYLFPINNNYQ